MNGAPTWVHASPLTESWWQFHCDHPDVEAKLVELARGLTSRGHKRLGIGMLWENLRYYTMLGASPDEDFYRLNNNHRAYFVRHVIETYPEFCGVFSTRTCSIDRNSPSWVDGQLAIAELEEF